MADPEGTEDWRAALRAKGYRLTPQRELVLAAVERLEHATPESVLADVRTSSSAINLSTVYRNLEVLEELGLVRHTHLSERVATYHTTTGRPHFHLVCRKCERVISVDPEVAEPFVTRLREEFAFETDIGHLTVFGECSTDAEVDEKTGERTQEGTDDE
ncbi:MAG: Fur family transcriptional regulator [Nocardioides sp.]|uniref:Fur family transcriptional regulator n=1 Tax=Nocardioides sp. TaxID=35761 RepID=UPI0039E256B3